MLALAFRAGASPLAVAVRQVVEVLPRMPLREPTLAPPAVVGLLPYRGTLTPVVDLCQIAAGRPAARELGTRIILVEIGEGTQRRLLGLLAEDVGELLPMRNTVAGLRLSEAPWLGAHIAEHPDLPQLVEPAEILPEALMRLFVSAEPAP
jgi:chemotaxis-related protein WspB